MAITPNDALVDVASERAARALTREAAIKASPSVDDLETIVASSLAGKGYHVFASSLPSHNWFRGLYSAFDRLVELIENDPTLDAEWDQAVRAWHATDDTAMFYCKIPPSFKDRAGRVGKRNKCYLQYCQDFALSEPFVTSRLGSIPEVCNVFQRLEELHFTCVDLFHRSFRSIFAGRNDMDKVNYPGRFSPIMFKLLRYNSDPRRFGTGPHYDKSALSLLLHSDDAEVTYRLGPFSNNAFRYSELHAPISYPSSSNSKNHAVLVCGSCLQAVGLSSFQPTPHSVLPIKKAEKRHSIVAFHIVPYLDTTNLVTKASYINDYDPDVR